MTSAEAALSAFTMLNIVRLAGYVSQIAEIARDKGGAPGVSCLTWTIFAMSNLATVLYAALSLHDGAMACIFAANTAGCVAILLLTRHKRLAARRRAGAARPPRAPAPPPAARCRA